MSQPETTARFDFALEFPQNWPQCLQKFKKEGIETVISHVYWGLHETSPGIRDFSKASKLKIEKFLQVVSSAGLSVDLVFGFMPSRHTFPEWVKTQTPHTSLIPAGIYDGISGPYFLSEAPSIEAKEVVDSFLAFFEEALTFLPLYQAPEGALRRVIFDPGIYKYNQSIMEGGSFAEWLQTEYKDISILNKKYQTAFNHFSNAGSKTGLRVLLDKRPWVAAYDYKSARHSHLNNLSQRVKNLSSEIKIQIKTENPDLSSAWNVVFDGVFIEGDTEMFPFTPEALVLPQSVQGFRFLQSIQEEFADWSFSPLPLWKSELDVSIRNAIVINGKYLTESGINWIKSSLSAGGDLFFPFGVPQFDEEMRLAKLLEGIDKDIVQLQENLRVQVYKIGKGRLIIFDTPPSYDANFTQTIRNVTTNLTESRGLT